MYNNNIDTSSIKQCENDNDWGEIVDYNTKCNNQLFDSLSINFTQNICNHTINDDNLTDKIQKIMDYMDIEEIKSWDIRLLDDLILLEKASIIAKNLKFQFNKRCNEDQTKFMTWIVTSLIWMKKVMIELAERNKQNIASCIISMDKQIKNPTHISRTSYKFCEFGCACKFNYNIKETCYSQHYVFNSASQDISNIIDFMVADYDTITMRQLHNNDDLIEIKTSINTITYVINHMYDELTQLKNDNKYYYENYTKRVYNFNVMHRNKKYK
jgi:hypothetical protein